jgi:hypothetical protein
MAPTRDTLSKLVRSYTCEPTRRLVPDGNGSKEAYYTCPHMATTGCPHREGEACNNDELYVEGTRFLYRILPWLDQGHFEAPVGHPVLRTRARNNLVALADAVRL